MGIKDTKLVIDAIDRSDIVGKLAGMFNFDAITITGVSDMVDRIIAKAESEGGRNTIYRLSIIGHGAPGIQSIGGGPNLKKDKYLKTDILMQYAGILGRLRPYFRRDAIVTLQGCKVGEGADGSNFLRKLSVILGVPVQASERTQYVLIPGMEGPIKRCTPIACGNPNERMQKPKPPETTKAANSSGAK